MLKPGLIRSLPELATPVLTVYLDTDQAKLGNRGLKPGYLTRLESQATLMAETLSPGDRTLFREQVERVGTYLNSHPLICRGIVIFAGPNSWELVPLQTEVEDEVRWGNPALAQLFWVLDEHRPFGVVVAGRKRVQFFLYWLGEMLELEEKEFRLEESRKKEMGPIARPGVRMSRGTDRDVFEHHVTAQYAHYQRQVAEHIERWCAAEHLDSVLLVGLAEMVRDVQKELPQDLRERVALVEEDLGWVSRAELQQRIEPIVVSREREREMALVEGLLGGDRGVTLGIDETLAQLQQERIRRLALVKGLNGSLQQCVKCSWVDRTADPACPICGGERRAGTLRQILPELARRHNVSVEIVSGEAARRLQEAGGMGAWLREFERKEQASA